MFFAPVEDYRLIEVWGSKKDDIKIKTQICGNENRQN